jgi:polyphosphate kinase
MKESLFYDKEFGWLAFNSRVLSQAEDPRIPLLERVHFSNIFHSNLDEFFMKRVGRFKNRLSHLAKTNTRAHAEALDYFDRLLKQIKELNIRNRIVLSEGILPSLAESGVGLVQWDELKSREQSYFEKYFQEKIFPVLTPMAVDQGHPFPLISNLSFSLAVKLRVPRSREKLFARVKNPAFFSNWLVVPFKNPDMPFRFLSTMDLIRQYLDRVFPKMEIVDVTSLQITRSIEVEERDEEDAEDLLEFIEEELKLRKFAEVTRIEFPSTKSPWLMSFVKEGLEAEDKEISVTGFPLEWKRLDSLMKLRIPSLRYKKHVPIVAKRLKDKSESIFEVIREKDLLVHHPYESFQMSVLRFLNEAADDKDVVSIKITLYRTGEQSELIDALVRAARSGKDVVCVIELKARLDEARNIQWARHLEDEGIHVVYGMQDLKVHAKVALIVRRERSKLRTYAHIGSGNYNPLTAQFYTDLGLFTSDSRLTKELTEVFHFLTGRSLKENYKHLLVSPVNMEQSFLKLIEAERKHAKAGRPARIMAKFNNFDDEEIILALYQAASEGVKIDLVVRGFSTLLPQRKGLSENIRVFSVIGRFLEHSRIFFFQNGKQDPLQGSFFMGSADWMRRNLHDRVELVTPIYDFSARSHLWDYLQLLVSEDSTAWQMDSRGHYKLRSGLYHIQEKFIGEFGS